MTAKEIADLFSDLELQLVASLKRNLAQHKKQEEDEGGQNGVPEQWEAWQSAKLRDIRRFRQENQDILGEYTPRINAETESILQEQHAEGGADGFFRTSDDKLRALIEEMQNNVARVEKAAMRYMDDVYRKTVLRSAVALSAGGVTLQQAVDSATKDFLAKGINCVEYSNGRRVNIADYAEMALRTCATRAKLIGEARQRERLGINTVLVSQYGACSDTCLPWQGKVYIDDVFQEYTGPRGGSFGVAWDGHQYLFLSVAIKAGLFHPNCRHTITTWIRGVSKMPKPMDAAKIEKVNKLEAEQRGMERDIRKTKREIAGLMDPEAVKKAEEALKQQQEDLKAFIKEHNDVLRRDPWRERYDGITSESKRNISKSDENVIENGQSSVIIKSNMGDKEENSMPPAEDFKTIEIAGKDGAIEVHEVGEINPQHIESEFGKIRSNQVIVTDERIQHIKDHHPQDYELFLKYGKETVIKPDLIIQDTKNTGTAFYVKKLTDTNLNVIIRLALEGDDPNYLNSVMSFYRIRESNLKKLIKKNKLLYFSE